MRLSKILIVMMLLSPVAMATQSAVIPATQKKHVNERNEPTMFVISIFQPC